MPRKPILHSVLSSYRLLLTFPLLRILSRRFVSDSWMETAIGPRIRRKEQKVLIIRYIRATISSSVLTAKTLFWWYWTAMQGRKYLWQSIMFPNHIPIFAEWNGRFSARFQVKLLVETVEFWQMWIHMNFIYELRIVLLVEHKNFLRAYLNLDICSVSQPTGLAGCFLTQIGGS
jgi:hypothetical protein